MSGQIFTSFHPGSHARRSVPASAWRTATAVALLFPFLLCVSRGQSQAPPHYKEVEFTTFLGQHRDEDITDSMNRRGQIAGRLEYIDQKTARLVDRAFLWRDGRVTWLSPPPGFLYSTALAQNESGLVVGQVSGGPATSGKKAACEWVGGRPRLLPTRHPGDSIAEAVNARGDMVGSYRVSSSHSQSDHACLWKHGGGFLDLGPVSGLPMGRRGTGWFAKNINDHGQVWGYVVGAVTNQSGPTPVFWEKGRARPATPQDGRRIFEITNRWGQVLRGSTLVSGGRAIPLLWQGRAAHGSALNDSGDVVGGMPAVKLNLPPWAQRSDYDNHAFLYREGRMYDLNGLVVKRAGEVLTEAIGTDDAGRILVWGRNRLILLFPDQAGLGRMRGPKKGSASGTLP